MNAANSGGDAFGTFTDERDGQTYRTVKMPDGKVWMAQNLNYKPESGNSWCYNDDESMGEKYGRLYDWETALAVVPKGWHLPSRQEWDDLITAVGGDDVACKKLKSKSGWYNNGNGNDEYGFSALPGGFRCANGSFGAVCGFGEWWEVRLLNNGDYPSGGDYQSICANDRMGVVADYADEGEGHSVRCIAD